MDSLHSDSEGEILSPIVEGHLESPRAAEAVEQTQEEADFDLFRVVNHDLETTTTGEIFLSLVN